MILKLYNNITINETRSSIANRVNLYLKFRKPIYSEVRGRSVKSEPLRMYKYIKARTPGEREHNRQTDIIVQKLKHKREYEINAGLIETNENLHEIERRKLGESLLIDSIISNSSNANNLKKTIDHIREVFGEIRLIDITPNHSKRLLDYLKNYTTKSGKNYGENSIRLHFGRYVWTIRKAIKDGILPGSVLNGVKLPNQAETFKNDLTGKQLVCLFEGTGFTNHHIHRACMVALNTGFRYSDIEALKWGQIKREKDGLYIELREEKTDKIVRMPIIDDDVVTKFIGLPNPPDMNSKVFPGLTHGRVYTAIRKHCKACNVPEWSFHDLRHTFATELMKRGVPIEVIRTLLNHKSIKTTMNYLHVNDKTKIEALQKVKFL